ncbi:MAG: hypothetical protein HZC40_04605 [Chloroflexi bacterium]|nr:hypothetical protein [Chloroflexota bacterium]
MLTGIHFILSYQCVSECDHCFVFGSPNARGTFTRAQIQCVLDEAKTIGTVKQIYFEGGEPTLFYPLLLESVKRARANGFDVGIVTNAYFATTEDDAALWLAPLRDLGVNDLSISDDAFHSSEEISPAKRALNAARKLGMPVGAICIEPPRVESAGASREKGKPVVGGDVMFRGRAAEKLTRDLPTRSWEEFTECPHEDLDNPERVHVDAFGNAHICQGLTMGNLWQTPLATLAQNYRADAHPICAPLVVGGPALLATEYNVPHADGYVDACHFCFSVRK